MKYTEFKYTRRHNTGNYEFEEATLGAVIEDGEDAQEIGAKVKNQVEVFLGLAKAAPKKEAPKKEAPKAETLKEEPKKEEPKKEAPKKKAAAKKPKKEEPAVTYDRSIKAHKDELVNVFDELRPNWNKNKELAKVCKGISEEMVGEPIFSAKGDILQSFTDKIEELLIEGEEDSSDL